MFSLEAILAGLLASTLLVHAQSPGSHEIFSQAKQDWLRSLEDAPIPTLNKFRLFSGGETHDVEWTVPSDRTSSRPDEVE